MIRDSSNPFGLNVVMSTPVAKIVVNSNIAGARVLVVDDDAIIPAIVSKILEQHHVEATTASNAKDASALLESEQFDLVITDIRMPGDSGVDLLARIRKTSSRLPVVIMTGMVSVEAAVECMKIGANDYVSKPFTAEKLIKVVEQVLEETRREAIAELNETKILNGYVGSNIGGYEIAGVIGEGNRGIVLLAERWVDQQKEQYALKLMKVRHLADDKMNETLVRFEREARVAARINHPNVVKIMQYSLTRKDKTPYIVMEYVKGKTLTQYIGDPSLNVIQKITILRQIVDALQAVHEQGLAHRDIKPGNIMIDEQRTAKLADFGTVRLPDSELTMAYDIIGTPAYLAPEAFHTSDVDHRADLFSLGVVAYELLFGTRPFAGTNIATVSQSITRELPVEPRKLDHTCPMRLQQILAKMLTKEIDRRYQSSVEILADIDELLERYPDRVDEDLPPPAATAIRDWK